MKRKIFLFLFITAFYSCSDNDSIIDIDELSSLEVKSSLTIPTGDWESWNTIKLASNKTVYLPWSLSQTLTAIPDAIRFDIKSEDGWTLLRNTIKEGEQKMNYLIFYNKFTGVLKGFYYLEEQSLGNNSFWRVSFDGGNQKIFYNQDGFFTYPLSVNKSIKGVNVMNITDNPTKGLTVGWNCFQVELAYDPNQPNLSLSIDTYQKNIGSITINGAYKSTSSGTIISSTSSNPQSSNPFSAGNITAVADSAKGWILNNISIGGDKRPIKGIAGNTITGIVNNDISSVLGTGVKFLFNTFSASSGTTSPLSLQFTTAGSVVLSGETNTPSTTSIPPIKISLNANQKLGAWNLEKAPTIKIGQYATLENITYQGYCSYYISKNIDNLNTVVLVNPEIQSCDISKSIEYIYRTGAIENSNPTSITVPLMKKANPADKRLLGANIISKTRLIFEESKNNNIVSTIRILGQGGNPYFSYTTVYLDRYPDKKGNGSLLPAIDLGGFSYTMDTEILGVTVTIRTKINGKDKMFTSTRMFEPEYVFSGYDAAYHPYVWTYNELKKYSK